MRRRRNLKQLLLPLIAMSALTLTGCASGGGGGGNEEEGYPPQENTNTNSAEIFILQAEAGDLSRYDDALASANLAIAEDSLNPLGYFQAARAQIGREEYAAANDLFAKAVELYPNYEQQVETERENAWINLFNASIPVLDAGDREEGIRILENAEQIYPRKRAAVLINLGVNYNALDRTSDAIDAFAAALDVIERRIDEVDSTTFATWVEQRPRVLSSMAQLMAMSERFDEAANAYRTYLDDNPDDISALANLAGVLVQGGMPDSAQAIYDGLLSGEGLTPQNYFNVGVGLYQAEVFDKAAEAFKMVAEVGPQNRDAVYNWAQSLYEDASIASDEEAPAKWDALLPVAQQLVELDALTQSSHQLMGQALIKVGQEQEGVSFLERARDMPFYLQNNLITPRSGGGGTVSGEFVNQFLEEGATVTIRVHFVAVDGSVVGSIDVRIDVPSQNMAMPFTAELTSDDTVLGYSYELVSPM